MILTCPECATRYTVDAAKFPAAGRNVRCAKCGHVWFESPAPPDFATQEAVAEPEISSAPEPHSYAAEPSAPSFAPAPVAVPKAAAAPAQWPRRAALVAGWLGLAVIVLGVGAAIALFRHRVIEAWPQSASLYAAIGDKTNASGLQVDDLKSRQTTEDGHPVLAVSGMLVNVTRGEVPVPPLRVALSDGDNRELYHWTFAPDVMTLGPGQSLPFVTKLSSPPTAARHLDVRFAKAGE